MKIVSVGDIMPGGVLSVKNNEYATNEVRDYLFSGDLRVGNFVCVIEVQKPSGKKIEAGGNSVFIKEKDANRVKDLGIDIVSLANNHRLSRG